MAGMERDIVFNALTRPQMFAGVSYSFFVFNLVVTTEMFLITKSFWAIVTAVLLHAFGYLMCLREPRWLDLWIQKVSRWMGHANINTTDSIYTHLFNGSHDDDMDCLDALAHDSSTAAPLRTIGG